jgi:hypothetical protein
LTGLTRRHCLKQIGLAAIAVGAGEWACASVEPESMIDIAVFDAAVPTSRDLAAMARVQIETGSQRSTRWQALRSARVRPGQHVAGVTTWSDWTVVRGMLSQNGLRVRSEQRLPGGLFQWEMA